MKKGLIISLLAAAAVVGCTKESSVTPSSTDNTVSFSSEIVSRTATTDNKNYTWVENTDQIGISTVGFTTECTNVAYYAASSAATTSFSAVGDKLLFPNVAEGDNRSVIFYAYYPYGDVTSNLRTIDITDQKANGLCSVDFMTATSSSVSYYVGAVYSDVVLDFDHELSQVVMSINCNDDITTLKGLSASLNIETEGSYFVTTSDIGKLSGSLSEVDDVALTVVEGDETDDEYKYIKTATVTAILHPGTYTSATLSFVVNGTTYSATFAQTLEPGESYPFKVYLGNDFAIYKSDSNIGGWGSENSETTIYPEKK